MISRFDFYDEIFALNHDHKLYILVSIQIIIQENDETRNLSYSLIDLRVDMYKIIGSCLF